MTRAGETRKIFKGDFLIKNDVVKTGNSGLVILGFGQGYMSRMKITPKTALILQGKKKDSEDKNKIKTNFFLELGSILVDYINKDKPELGVLVQYWKKTPTKEILNLEKKFVTKGNQLW